MSRKNNILFGGIISILTFASCLFISGCEKVEPIDQETLDAICEKINIAEKDEVYGNIYLPSSVDGASITWESSKPEVVSDKKSGSKEAGVVKRTNKDVCVTLTATITKDGKVSSYSQDLYVMKLEKELTDDDFVGYLFGHFIGESAANQEQMYFALAEDGFNFKDMNNSKPVLTCNIEENGVRDPYICRSPEGDRFFIVATSLSIYNRGGWGNARGQSASKDGSHNLIMWQSNDLVNWSEPMLLPVAPENAGMAWAPEMIFDEKTGQYVIFFASSLVNEDRTEKTKLDAIYYVTTRDFVHISEPKILIDNQDDPDGTARTVIDATIINIDGTYYTAVKDGDNNVAGGGLRVLETQDLFDPDGWEKAFDMDELGLDFTGQRINRADNGTLEGPEFFKFNKSEWIDENTPTYCLMADQYNANAGYLPFMTTDITDFDNSYDSWSIMNSSQYSFDKLKKRHGTVLNITADEIEAIKAAYPNS